MKQEIKNQILDAIVQIAMASKDKKTEIFTLPKIRKLSKPIVEKYSCTTEEAILFAIMFARFFERGYAVDVDDISRHLDCDAIELIQYEYLFQSLLKKRLVALDFNENRTNKRIRAYFNYIFKPAIIKTILSNAAPKPPVVISSSVTLLGAIKEHLDQYIDKQISFEDIEAEVMDLLSNHADILLAQKIELLDMAFAYKLLLLYVIVEHYKGETTIDLNKALEELFWQDDSSYSIKSIILKQQMVLFSQNILKSNPSFWRNDVEIELTQEGAIYLFGDEAKLVRVGEKESKKKHLIKADEIIEKQMFYNPEDVDTIHLIQDLMQEEKYQAVANRLKAKNMPGGIAILLHGKPGTGKTETVYQLARQTQRNVYRVEISEVKSMWFGESQKQIKDIFRDYYKYMEEQKNIPILFFNEADGIINKRKDSNSSNVAQTENEIQNIILQEMEDFKGIMIATTNLTDNIDTAFDRRFLFKLQLGVPDAATRFKIYRSMIEYLDDTIITKMADNFEFSGGVIQNIARKSTMFHVMNGIHPDVEWYMESCKQENLSRNSLTKIGFK